MNYPTFSLEYELFQNGYEYIAGIDEVGRGCLAGPVVAAAVLISKESHYISGVRDSKTVTEKQRNLMKDQIQKKVLNYSYGQASAREIDDFGIGNAVSIAMNRAYAGLSHKPSIVLIDGTMIKAPWCHGRTIKSGDAKHFVISAASVIAKVYRDNMMYEIDDKYPDYGFDQHVGYGTKQHRSAIIKHGPSKIHRFTFSPIKGKWKRRE